jgi:hypothetical protein
MSTDWDELRERARRAEHEDGVLRYLRGEVTRLAALRDERGSRFAAEARDVQELDDFSLGGLLELWLGTREKRVEREQREELAARLAFEEVKGEHAKLAARAARLELAAPERTAARRAFAEARARRAAELRARGGTPARRVAELEERMEAHERRRIELAEALALCTLAEAELEALRAALADAWGHGAVDLFARGYHAERSAAEGERKALNTAHAHAQETAVLLTRLSAELADTGLRFEPRFQLPETFSVADWWLDGVVMDWLSLRRTSAARERTSEVLDAVRALALRLRQEESALESELARDRRLLEGRLEGRTES